MKERKRAQIAVEYLILTAFILVSVAIIFAFSFVNYNQNIRIAKANETLAKMANSVDDIYTRGEGNTRFEDLSLPEGMTELEIVHKCVDASTVNQGTALECKTGAGGALNEYEYVKFSAISMTVQLIGGESNVMRQTKAKIYEDIGDMSDLGPGGVLNKYSGSAYTIRTSWDDSAGPLLVKIEKV